MAPFVDRIALICSVHSISAKDLFAMHGAVRAISMIAIALLGARGSILQINITRTKPFCTSAVLGKVAYILGWPAECPRAGIVAV